MKIRVYTNRVKINYQSAFTKAKEYFLAHGVDLAFDFEQSDLKNLVSYHRVLSTNPLKERVLLSSVFNKLPISIHDITMFVFNAEEFAPKEIPTGLCYFPGKPFIDISTHRNNPPTAEEYTFVEICHELMHALTFIANQKGFNIPDFMDSYKENANPNSPTGNFATQWKLLQPYLKALGSPTKPQNESNRVYLTRQGYYDGIQTLGSINTKGFSCKTLERPWKNNAPNISCIPVGVYTCKWSFSPRFLKYTYEVLNVPKRTGIRIHSGNFFFDIAGCILLGDSYRDVNADGKVDILNSRATVAKFEEIMQKKSFILEIK